MSLAISRSATRMSPCHRDGWSTACTQSRPPILRPRSMSNAGAGVLSPASAVSAAQEVVTLDLDYMCEALHDELDQLSGKQLLITGGAGFLGYYRVQVALHWTWRTDGDPIRVTVLDSFLRGCPHWLENLAA